MVYDNDVFAAETFSILKLAFRFLLLLIFYDMRAVHIRVDRGKCGGPIAPAASIACTALSRKKRQTPHHVH